MTQANMESPLPEASPSSVRLVIEASAGTGKTYRLTEIYADLVKAGVLPESILVVTFTEKATRELRQRIRDRLIEQLWSGDQTSTANRTQIVQSFDRATIQTIHGFAASVLKDHALTLGRPLDIQHTDGIALRRAALLATLSQSWPPLLGALLYHAIQETGEAKLQGALDSWSNFRGRLSSSVDLRSPTLLGMFSAEALLEGLADRLAKLRVDAEVDAAEETSRLERLHGAIERWANTAETDGLRELRALASDVIRADKKKKKASSRSFWVWDNSNTLNRALWLIARPGLLLSNALLPTYQNTVHKLKGQMALFEPDDLIEDLSVALRNATSKLRNATSKGESAGTIESTAETSSEIIASIRARYDIAMIDEFQDTDALQWDIFSNLFEKSAAHGLVVIGDPKQAIYGFRNADVLTYREATAALLARGATVHQLGVNRRSSEPLIKALDLIFDRGFFSGNNGVIPKVAAASAETLTVDDAPLTPIAVALDVKRPITWARSIGQEIRRLRRHVRRQGNDKKGETLLFSDFMVLVSDRYEAKNAATGLGEVGVPFSLSGGSVFKSDEAQDLYDLLGALIDPSDDGALRAAARTPFFCANPSTLSVWPLANELRQRLLDLAELTKRIGFDKSYREIVHQTGLRLRMRALETSERRMVNFDHLVELISLHVANTKDLLAIRQYVAHRITASDLPKDEYERGDRDRDAVSIMTLHAAKGLEADVVFFMGKMRSRPPSDLDLSVYHEGDETRHTRFGWVGPVPESLAFLVQDELQEERERVAYVALTRARHRIYLPLFEGTKASAYGVIHSRLERLVGPALEEGGELPSGFCLFRTKPVKPTSDTNKSDIHRDRPAPPKLVGHSSEALRVLGEESLGPEFTSYSRMKARHTAEPEWFLELGQGAQEVPLPDESHVVRTAADQGSLGLVDVGAADAIPEELGNLVTQQSNAPILPSGAAFGVLIHELLEHVDFAHLLTVPTLSALCDDVAVTNQVRQLLRSRFWDSSHTNGVLGLLWNALRSPVDALGLQSGFAELADPKNPKRVSMEVPFVQRLEGGPNRSTPAGYLRGVIDMVFESDGEVFWLDWKTDQLPSYDPKTLEAQVAEQYDVQLKVYSVALARQLGLFEPVTETTHRFGGVFYAFVRGMTERPGQNMNREGLLLIKPTIDELRQWNHQLTTATSPFGTSLPRAVRQGRRASSD